MAVRAVAEPIVDKIVMTNSLLRRLVTIPGVVLGFGLVTVLLPVLYLVLVAVDAVRALRSNASWVGIRILTFLWLYLLGEVSAVVALFLIAFRSGAARTGAIYSLQRLWVRWNFRAVVSIFGLDVSVEGSDEIAPGPIIVLSRHASLIDTLIPGTLISSMQGIDLRYVLKRELLLDPALDIAGSRLPNVFVDRGAPRSDGEFAAIRDLARDLGPGEGVLIYPEGTRFSERKRISYTKRLQNRGGTIGAVAARLRSVLPPRPGGTLAILEASSADVLLLGHHGLEGFAGVRDVWSGGLVGSTIHIRFWRIPRAEIPEVRSDRVNWLFRVWEQLDDWIEVTRSV